MQSLNEAELNSLKSDLREYLELEHDETAIVYWDAIDKLATELLQPSASNRCNQMYLLIIYFILAEIHIQVKEDVIALFKDKTLKQLLELEIGIVAKLSKGVVDVDYWESVLSKLKSLILRVRIKEIHAEMLEKLRIAYKEQQDEAVELEKARVRLCAEAAAQDEKSSSDSSSLLEAQQQQSESNRSLDPVYLTKDQVDLETALIVDPEQDQQHWETQRQKVKQDKMYIVANSNENILQNHIQAERNARFFIASNDPSEFSAAERQFLSQMANELNADEELFQSEVRLVKDHHELGSASTTLRPRKPRYFNRVISGYEWNRYNQTHYDFQNPPPKVVQGYKFTIFYPDLLDVSKPPTFTVLPDESSHETVILKFISSAPYEDIAFRIVNEKWDMTRRSGFRYVFERGILRLYFNLKRDRYRK